MKLDKAKLMETHKKHRPLLSELVSKYNQPSNEYHPIARIKKSIKSEEEIRAINDLLLQVDAALEELDAHGIKDAQSYLSAVFFDAKSIYSELSHLFVTDLAKNLKNGEGIFEYYAKDGSLEEVLFHAERYKMLISSVHQVYLPQYDPFIISCANKFKLGEIKEKEQELIAEYIQADTSEQLHQIKKKIEQGYEQIRKGARELRKKYLPLPCGWFKKEQKHAVLELMPWKQFYSEFQLLENDPALFSHYRSLKMQMTEQISSWNGLIGKLNSSALSVRELRELTRIAEGLILPTETIYLRAITAEYKSAAERFHQNLSRKKKETESYLTQLVREELAFELLPQGKEKEYLEQKKRNLLEYVNKIEILSNGEDHYLRTKLEKVELIFEEMIKHLGEGSIFGEANYQKKVQELRLSFWLAGRIAKQGTQQSEKPLSRSADLEEYAQRYVRSCGIPEHKQLQQIHSLLTGESELQSYAQRVEQLCSLQLNGAVFGPKDQDYLEQIVIRGINRSINGGYLGYYLEKENAPLKPKLLGFLEQCEKYLQ